MSAVSVLPNYTVATLGVDMQALLDQLNEVVELEQFAANTYRSHAGRLPEEWMQAKAIEFMAGAERGRDAALGLIALLGERPAQAKRALAGFLGAAKGLADTARSGRFGQLKDLQDMLIAAFLTAGGWTIVQWAAYGIGDRRLIEVAEQEVAQKSLPVQWLLVTIAERSAWAIVTP